jgi:copper chaperone CopZ
MGYMVTTTFKVDEIHCASCENTIRTALSRLPGVGVVVPSAERNDVKVSYDHTRLAEEQLRAALADVGFEPRP